MAQTAPACEIDLRSKVLTDLHGVDRFAAAAVVDAVDGGTPSRQLEQAVHRIRT
ncbi:MAG: hypothetical protein JF598_03885 [Streptomyces sp.]|nr:hypothetical protein [Streptomyces sp.]